MGCLFLARSLSRLGKNPPTSQPPTSLVDRVGAWRVRKKRPCAHRIALWDRRPAVGGDEREGGVEKEGWGRSRPRQSGRADCRTRRVVVCDGERLIGALFRGRLCLRERGLCARLAWSYVRWRWLCVGSRGRARTSEAGFSALNAFFCGCVLLCLAWPPEARGVLSLSLSLLSSAVLSVRWAESGKVRCAP